MATTHRKRVAPPTIGLTALRKSHGLTQAALAERVAAVLDSEFTHAALSAIEGGHRGASAEVLAALEQVFGLAAGDLAVDYDPSHSRRKKVA